MSVFAETLNVYGHLQAQVVRADGSKGEVVDLGTRKVFEIRRIKTWILAALLGGASVLLAKWFLAFALFGVVTTTGVNYMAADFLAGSGARINAFNFHDCGTGTNAEAIGNTALQTPAGSARVAGTQSNPSANIYRTIATITPGGSLAITEWGLFSASTVGTMWDRRVFAAINVSPSDSIQFTYSLTVTAGG